MGTVHEQLPECPECQGPIDIKKSTIMPGSHPRKEEIWKQRKKNGNCMVTYKSNILKI